jgi:catechol 2,3-dioxygenase-like lactoylglutathione lyase family enzyme
MEVEVARIRSPRSVDGGTRVNHVRVRRTTELRRSLGRVDGLEIRVTSVTIAAPDPLALADFYARLLGRPVTEKDGPRPGEPPTAGWAQIRRPEDGSQPTLNFEYERVWDTPKWPSEPGTQHASQHLDIYVSDLDAAVEHALQAGATLAPVQPQQTVRVLFDPAGHPFCLFT